MKRLPSPPERQLTQQQLDEFQANIGHHFTDPSLLEVALSHSSWTFENPRPAAANKAAPNKAASNERLELLGDSVLSMCVLDHIYRQYPHLSEGAMSEARSQAVRGTTLAKVAKRYGVGSVIKLGRGEDRGGGRNNPRLLEDALEAVIAAVYLDAGVEAAAKMVVRMLGDVIKESAENTPVTETDNRN